MSSLRLLLAAAVLATGIARAQAPVVDQSHVDYAGYGALGASINECCAQVFQTFTAGMSGTLVGVSAAIGSSATSQLRLSIQGVLPNGLPDGNVLATTTLASSSTTIDDFVALAPGARVSAGTTYALVADYVNAPPPGAGMCQGGWAGTTGNAYPGGENVMWYEGYGWLYQGDGYDVFFRTWVVADDADADGFGQAADCDDADASVFPGAPEVVGDGLDQDCNGHDLTIQVGRAVFTSGSSMLRVEATSALGAAAALEVSGISAMKWDELAARWVVNAKVAPPASVAVCGVEGCVSAAVVVK